MLGGRRGVFVNDNSIFVNLLGPRVNFKGESHVMPTLIIPISTCYYLELRNTWLVNEKVTFY